MYLNLLIAKKPKKMISNLKLTIGELEPNSLIFQDDIAKMEDSRKGATDVGRLFELKYITQIKSYTCNLKNLVTSF